MSKFKDVLIEIESCDASGMTISEIAEQVGWSERFVEDALMLIYNVSEDCYDDYGVIVGGRQVEFEDVPF